MRGRINLFPYIYLIFGVYFVTFGLGYIEVPEFILNVNNFIIAFGGVLFFIAAYNAIFHSKRRMMRRLSRV